MENKIIISNITIANYVMFKLDKIDNEFTLEELNNIKELIIDCNNETSDSGQMLEDILYLKNLETLIVRNCFLFKEDYIAFLSLNFLNNITFEKCEFEDADILMLFKIKSLSLINCNINSYYFISFFSDIQQLTIINGKVEIGRLNSLKELKYLQLSYTEITDTSVLETEGIEELYIDNTNIINFEFLKNMLNLKRLSIDEKQFRENKQIVKYLINNKVEVFIENMIKIGGDEYEI